MHNGAGLDNGFHWGFGFNHWGLGVIIWVLVIALLIWVFKNLNK